MSRPAISAAHAGGGALPDGKGRAAGRRRLASFVFGAVQEPSAGRQGRRTSDWPSCERAQAEDLLTEAIEARRGKLGSTHPATLLLQAPAPPALRAPPLCGLGVEMHATAVRLVVF